MSTKRQKRVSKKVWLSLVTVTVALSCFVCVFLVDRSAAKANDIESPFTKYDLTDAQLRGIASLCQQEQGSAQGAAAEASLMANHMDLRHNNAKKYENNGTGLYNYVRNGGWFAKAAYHMDNQSKLRPEVLNAVRTVLVRGYRTLPGYVDEHDCFSDISTATNNGVAIGVRDRGAYVSHTTIIKNKYGSTYRFFSFPTAKSDPFGYTSDKKRQQIGDFHYTYDASMYEVK